MKFLNLIATSFLLIGCSTVTLATEFEEVGNDEIVKYGYVISRGKGTNPVKEKTTYEKYTRKKNPVYNHSFFLNTFKTIAKKYQTDYRLYLAIAEVESSFRPYATNKREKDKDIGLMQINSWWIPRLRERGMYDERMLFDYEYNTDVGGWILRYCIDKFGTTTQAIDCYNKGENKAGHDSDYVRKVMRSYKKYVERYK